MPVGTIRSFYCKTTSFPALLCAFKAGGAATKDIDPIGYFFYQEVRETTDKAVELPKQSAHIPVNLSILQFN
ncbi:MAG: hypothetical protein ABF449_13145, partial [Ethanoligenens sp.]